MRALESLMSRLGEPKRDASAGNYVWAASATDVIAFLEAIHTDPRPSSPVGATREYIGDRARAGNSAAGLSC